VPGCAAWMPPVQAQLFAIAFASSREMNNLLRAAAGAVQGGLYPSPPSPLPFQGRGVPVR
ncbi:MAG: hypothetical protein ACKPJD_04210, partial [Planctomycetaceae bacterium]